MAGDNSDINNINDNSNYLEGGEDSSADNVVFVSKVQLEKVEVSGGEEEEESLLKLRAKLFIFVPEDCYGGETRTNFWKERGTGDLKLLKHREHKKVRLLMRQEKTLKICANHLVSPGVVLTPNVGSARSFVFTAMDYADEELTQETFAIRFVDEECASRFSNMIELSKKVNAGEMDADDLKPDMGKDFERVDPGLETAIDDCNKKLLQRRESVSAVNAQSDSEHDSQTEDVDEGSEARLKATVGDAAAADEISFGIEKVGLGLSAGGFKSVSVDNDEVKEAAKFAADTISKGKLHDIVEAMQQIVSGMIYKLKLEIKHADDTLQVYSVTVFKPLPHTEKPLQLEAHTHLGSK